eukprot:c18773_g1_i2.p1 GENE.c18773_g1_i2~~c18773_g1_i2.p1  ORF type:complete len:127 (-),score=34.02 c18773_g1_i2:28-408(-)
MEYIGDTITLQGNSGRIYGVALQTSIDEEPVYVSIGHKVSLSTAIEIVRSTVNDSRIPEPVNQADLRSREYISSYKKKGNKKNKVEREETLNTSSKKKAQGRWKCTSCEAENPSKVDKCVFCDKPQ